MIEAGGGQRGRRGGHGTGVAEQQQQHNKDEETGAKKSPRPRQVRERK